MEREQLQVQEGRGEAGAGLLPQKGRAGRGEGCPALSTASDHRQRKQAWNRWGCMSWWASTSPLLSPSFYFLFFTEIGSKVWVEGCRKGLKSLEKNSYLKRVSEKPTMRVPICGVHMCVCACVYVRNQIQGLPHTR